MGWAESGGGKWMFGPWMCGKRWKSSFLMFSYPMDKEWFVFGELLICFCWCAFALGNDVGVLLGTVVCWISDDDACFQPDIANVITFGGMLWTNPSFNYIFVVEWLGNSISMRFESLAPYTNGNTVFASSTWNPSQEGLFEDRGPSNQPYRNRKIMRFRALVGLVPWNVITSFVLILLCSRNARKAT